MGDEGSWIPYLTPSCNSNGSTDNSLMSLSLPTQIECCVGAVLQKEKQFFGEGVNVSKSLENIILL